MNSIEFGETAALGMTASARPAWRPPLRGRIVALTRPRYGAWIKDRETGNIEYTDCVWIDWIRA